MVVIDAVGGQAGEAAIGRILTDFRRQLGPQVADLPSGTKNSNRIQIDRVSILKKQPQRRPMVQRSDGRLSGTAVVVCERDPDDPDPKVSDYLSVNRQLMPRSGWRRGRTPAKCSSQPSPHDRQDCPTVIAESSPLDCSRYQP